MRHASGLNRCLELAACGFSDVEDGSERAWREEGIARSQEHPRHVLVGRETVDEGSLADAGLAGHQHQPAVRAADDEVEVLLQRSELV